MWQIPLVLILMLDAVSNAVTQLQVKYRQWRLPDDAVHPATSSLIDEAIADLDRHGEVCLDDLAFTSTTKEEARRTFTEFAEQGYLEPVDGESDTWQPGELFEALADC